MVSATGTTPRIAGPLTGIAGLLTGIAGPLTDSELGLPVPAAGRGAFESNFTWIPGIGHSRASRSPSWLRSNHTIPRMVDNGAVDGLGLGDKGGDSLGDGDTVGDSLADGDTVGDSLGDGDTVGDSLA